MIKFSLDKKESSPAHRSSINNHSKRKSTELSAYPGTDTIIYYFNNRIFFDLDEKTFLNNGKTARSSLNEKSVYETSISSKEKSPRDVFASVESSVEHSKSVGNGGAGKKNNELK